MRKRSIGILLLVGVLVVGGGSFFSFRMWLNHWGDRELKIDRPILLVLKQNAPLSAFSRRAEAYGVVESALLYKWWVKLFSDYSRFQAGRYRLSGRVSPRSLSDKLVRGDVFIPVALEYNIPEGFTYAQAAERLLSYGVGTKEVFERLFGDREFLDRLAVRSSSLEGYLFPATYSFSKMPSPEEALTRAVETFFKRLPADYERRVAAMGLGLEDAVTFASLIQKETSDAEEKPLISEVIWRRLKNRAPLGIDAAIIYGIDDYRGNISKKHLVDGKNPYNTRVHVGLPPTPICSPDLASLLAVLQPSNLGYYYFVVEAGTTKHHFSKTLSEHNRYVRKLVDYNRRRRR